MFSVILMLYQHGDCRKIRRRRLLGRYNRWRYILIDITWVTDPDSSLSKPYLHVSSNFRRSVVYKPCWSFVKDVAQRAKLCNVAYLFDSKMILWCKSCTLVASQWKYLSVWTRHLPCHITVYCARLHRCLQYEFFRRLHRTHHICILLGNFVTYCIPVERINNGFTLRCYCFGPSDAYSNSTSI